LLQQRCEATKSGGTPQGAVVSPTLSNVYLHYVFDLWAHRWRKHQAWGEVILVRYAGDVVAGFEHKGTAKRFLADLRHRMAKFALSLHPDKTASQKTQTPALCVLPIDTCRERLYFKEYAMFILQPKLQDGFQRYCTHYTKASHVRNRKRSHPCRRCRKGGRQPRRRDGARINAEGEPDGHQSAPASAVTTRWKSWLRTRQRRTSRWLCSVPLQCPRDIEKGLAAGFLLYLTKPIKVNEFMDTLDVAFTFAKMQSARTNIEKKAAVTTASEASLA
jgi:hypothetical protein